jgi:hypothetical protein
MSVLPVAGWSVLTSAPIDVRLKSSGLTTRIGLPYPLSAGIRDAEPKVCDPFSVADWVTALVRESA